MRVKRIVPQGRARFNQNHPRIRENAKERGELNGLFYGHL